ncbi:MAG TPA: aspartate/glutamate racemase family protein [Ruminiclostridium sp.]|nr:aspartate/glutamate racemase family protein [Ruminiclostridium sp.]
MSITVALLHTANGVANLIKEPFSEYLPQVKVLNLVDEGILQELMREGALTPKITRKVCQHVVNAEEYGADAVLVTCSSLGQCINPARQLSNIKVCRIDEAMAVSAVEKGKRIGVVATINTTLLPTCQLIKEKAAEMGRSPVLDTALCDSAFQAFLKGDIPSYEKLIIERVEELSRRNDVVVLSQASMTPLVSRLRLETPVLSSIQSGILNFKETLGL